MKNIHILPTDKPSKYVTNYMEQTMQWHNIYITSDKEIKEGDWFLYQEKLLVRHDGSMNTLLDCKKIIITTDQDLIKDGVQAINDEFLEWFVKNPSCESVEVTYNKDVFPYGVETAKGCGWYKIIIPKEEPKQIKCYCGHTTYCDCGPLEEPKQETLEEAAGRFSIDIREENYKDGFIEGAKWQQERMYSEADKIMKFLDNETKLGLSDGKTIERIKWYFETYFEQFKKK